MPYVVPYLALMLLATPLGAGIGAAFPYWAFALAIIPTFSAKNDARFAAAHAGVIAACLIWIASRLLPLMRWGTSGLGADIAAHHANFERCFSALASCAAHPAALMGYPFHMAGIPTDWILIGLLITANGALGIALWGAARAYLGREAAGWTAIVFALSLPQFIAYWSFFLPMQISLALGVFGLVIFRKQSYFAIPLFAAAGIIHFVAFIPLAIMLGIHAVLMIRTLRPKIIFASSLALVLLYHAPRLAGYAASGIAYASGAYGMEQAVLLAGHFVTLDFYHNALMVFYLPFALMGIALALREKTARLPVFAAIIPLILATSGIIFHNRFLIVFDTISIVFAGYAISRFAASVGYAGRIALYAMMIFLAGYALTTSWRMEPLVNKEEFEEIAALRAFASREETPIFVNNGVYRQFVEHYAERTTISAPFTNEPWLTVPEAMIYNGRRSTPFEPYNDPHFTRVSDRVWLYHRSF